MKASICSRVASEYCDSLVSKFALSPPMIEKSFKNMVMSTLYDTPVATPRGVVYQGGKRHLRSGAYIVQHLESWIVACIVRICGLKLQQKYGCSPIRAYNILGDDLLLSHVAATTEVMAILKETARNLGLQLKPEYNIGNNQQLDLLGYTVTPSGAISSAKKLVASLLLPERSMSNEFRLVASWRQCSIRIHGLKGRGNIPSEQRSPCKRYKIGDCNGGADDQSRRTQLIHLWNKHRMARRHMLSSFVRFMP